MKEIGKYSTVVVAGVLILVAFYFFEYKPSIKDARDEGYKAGLKECQQDTDTVTIKADPVIGYRDTSFAKQEPAVPIVKDSLYKSFFDTTTISGKDTISANAKVVFDISTEKADWEFEIKHRDFIQLPDTIRITTPRYIEKVVVENNWLYNLISFIGGIAVTIITFLTAT